MNTLAEAPPKEPSEADILTGLQEKVSASRLSLFLQCRLKFYFRYVLRLTKPKTPSLHVGNSVHAVLKKWNKVRWLQTPLSLKQAHDAYVEAWADTSEGKPFWETGEEDAEKTTGWRLVDTYLRESHVPAELKPDAVEVPVEADLAAHGLPRLIGILDLVQRRQIIDYKTSSTTPNSENWSPIPPRSRPAGAPSSTGTTPGKRSKAFSSITWSNSRTRRSSSPRCRP